MAGVIARLYPWDDSYGYAGSAVDMNNSRRVESSLCRSIVERRDIRESTATSDDFEDVGIRRKAIELRFAHRPQAAPGFVLGNDEDTCDIVLPQLKHISRRHCCLTFDNQRRLILWDFSTHGTIVTYDGKGRQYRRGLTWIIGGSKIPDTTQEIVIQLSQHLKFRIVVGAHFGEAGYTASIDAFCLALARSVQLQPKHQALQPSTTTSITTDTLSRRSLLLDKEVLGIGAYSVVYRVWDVSTGVEYASKRTWGKCHEELEYLSDEGTKEKYDRKSEALLLRKISHAHVVHFHCWREAPRWEMIMEYMPLGNLKAQNTIRRITPHEMAVGLQQILSALVYLHGRKPSVVHRDIKPANILVQTREPFHTKLGDFGLSKASDDLETWCGSDYYMAPEILKGETPYTKAVDVWSLGVVATQYAHSLPPRTRGFSVTYCGDIREHLAWCKSDTWRLVLSKMLVEQPKRRGSAKECLKVALMLTSQPDQAEGSFTARSVSSSKVSGTPPPETISGIAELSTTSGATAVLYVDPRDGVCENVTRFLNHVGMLNGVLGVAVSASNIDALRCQLRRLSVSRLTACLEQGTKMTVVRAVTKSRDLTIAYFSASELAASPCDVVRSLIGMLMLVDPDDLIKMPGLEPLRAP